VRGHALQREHRLHVHADDQMLGGVLGAHGDGFGLRARFRGVLPAGFGRIPQHTDAQQQQRSQQPPGAGLRQRVAWRIRWRGAGRPHRGVGVHGRFGGEGGGAARQSAMQGMETQCLLVQRDQLRQFHAVGRHVRMAAVGVQARHAPAIGVFQLRQAAAGAQAELCVQVGKVGVHRLFLCGTS
jgi:hypothetical protein